MFKAVLIERDERAYRTNFKDIDEVRLPPGEVTVRVEYSTLNYKDALAITGKAPVVRQFPMIPGIDLAGIVEHSDDPNYRPGDKVLLNGWGVGEGHWGGLSQESVCAMHRGRRAPRFPRHATVAMLPQRSGPWKARA